MCTACTKWVKGTENDLFMHAIVVIFRMRCDDDYKYYLLKNKYNNRI